MGQDKDKYLVPAEQVLATADMFVKDAEEFYASISNLNGVVTNNLDKNLTATFHEHFQILWSAWYPRLQDVAKGIEALGIMAEKLVVGTLQTDNKAAQAYQDDPQETAQINRDIADIQKDTADFDKKFNGDSSSTQSSNSSSPSSPPPNSPPPPPPPPPA
jgi:hypothetical protein